MPSCWEACVRRGSSKGRLVVGTGSPGPPPAVAMPKPAAGGQPSTADG